MSTFIIEGGHKISGTVIPTANKNSVVAIIPAAILSKEPIVLSNVPKSSSVRVLLSIFRSLGGKVAYLKEGKIRLDASTINKNKINKELAKKERSSNMFLGPLLARLGEAELGNEGGCKLGNRPIDTLIQGLKSLGAQIDPENIFHLTAPKGMNGADVWQLEASVTGTESLIMSAVLAKGTTVIYNAACEPHVQDLCNFLISIGADIEGVGTNMVVVNGVEKLHGGEWDIISDHIDIGGLIVAAAITGGELRIRKAIPSHMRQILDYYAKINLNVEVEGDELLVPGDQELYCHTNLKGDIDKIPAYPWPTGFPADLIPQAVVLAAKAKGSIKILNNMYETQLFFVEDLIKMRGNLILADPQRVITFGPSEFKGTTISAPEILQCAHAIGLAAFAAKGTTKILNADIISRRYPDFVQTFSDLGARISQQ